MVEEEHYLWIATVALVVVVADVMADYKAIVTIEVCLRKGVTAIWRSAYSSISFVFTNDSYLKSCICCAMQLPSVGYLHRHHGRI
jgi:hypothetical protein